MHGKVAQGAVGTGVAVQVPSLWSAHLFEKDKQRFLRFDYSFLGE
jgi:hypothetical protein